MAIVTGQMALNRWDQTSDLFNHTQLSDNFQKIDDHDHSPGKGRILGTSSYGDYSVTGSKLADLAVGPEKLASAAVTISKVAPALKPSGTAAANQEALRALGTASGTAAAGAHAAQHAAGGPDALTNIQYSQLANGNVINHIDVVSTLPANPPNRLEILYTPTATSIDQTGAAAAVSTGAYHLMYDATEASAYKWLCLGGAPTLAFSTTQKLTTGGAQGMFIKPLTVTGLPAGLYNVSAECYVLCVGESTLTGVGACIGPANPGGYPPGTAFMGRSQNAAPIMAHRNSPVTLASGQTIVIGAFNDDANMSSIVGHATISAIPIALKV